MKRFLQHLLTALLLTGVAFCQSTTTTGTAIDSDGITWVGGQVQISFVPNPSYPNISNYKFNNSALSPMVTSQTITLNGSGAFSTSLYDNTVVTPSGSLWFVNICPNASAACQGFTFQAVGASVNLTSTISASIQAPRFRAVNGSFGYADVEAQVQLATGSSYFNVTSSAIRTYSGTAWSAAGSNPSPYISAYGVAQPSSSLLTLTPTGTGNLNATYVYGVYYNTASGAGFLQGASYPTVVASNQQVQITTIPISSDPNVISRTICRVNNTADPFNYQQNIVVTIPDNVTTSYLDNNTDAAVQANPFCPYMPTGFGTYSIIGLGVVMSFGNTSVSIGNTSGAGTSGGYANTAVGANTMGALGTGLIGALRNTAVGVDALVDLTSGTSNTGLGVHADAGVTTGSGNVAIGYEAGQSITTGSFNIDIGLGAQQVGGTAITNTIAIGQVACYNCAASNTIAIGYEAFGNVATGFSGSEGLAIGYQAGFAATSANFTTLVGYQAGQSITSGAGNTAIGAGDGSGITTGTDNTSIGYAALATVSTNGSNTATGYTALQLATTSSNTADGASALAALTSGASQTCTGYRCMFYITTSSNNIAYGWQAGEFISGGATHATTVANSTLLGYAAEPLADGDTNEITLGYSVIGDGSNTATIGNSSITDVYLGSSTGAANIHANKLILASARKGTFVCTAGGTITITNSNYVTTSDVVITMNTAGGTITTPPAFKTVTSGTGFTVLCGATDTSTYNYDILN